MMKRILGLLVAAAMVVFAFAGCAGSPSPATSAAPAVTNAPASAAPAGKVNITLMSSKVEIQTDLQTVVDDYNQSQDKVTVELLGTSGDNYATVLQSQFSSSPEKAPTIFTISGPDASKFEQFMAPLASSKASGMIADNFKADVTVDGQIMGLPMAVEGYGLVYNKDMFQKAGVDASQITSIDALAAACEKLKGVEGVTHPLAFAKENYFIFIHPFNWAFAVSPDYAAQIDQLNKGQITMAGIPTVQQFAKDLDKLAPYTNQALDSYDDQVAGFVGGKFAMIHQGCWVQTMLTQDNIGFEYGMIPFPTSNTDCICVGTANAWRVNKFATAEQQQAAMDFLDWLITSDVGQSYCADTFAFIPAFMGVKAPSGVLSQEVSKYVQAGKTIPWAYNGLFPTGIDVDGATLMQKYYAGVINSDELLDQLTQAWVKDAK
jgi:raffinose/stachyose/melibiose transport system substrate-binding protein